MVIVVVLGIVVAVVVFIVENLNLKARALSRSLSGGVL